MVFIKGIGKNRVIDMPISEFGFSWFPAVGLAMAGFRPIVEFLIFLGLIFV